MRKEAEKVRPSCTRTFSSRSHRRFAPGSGRRCSPEGSGASGAVRIRGAAEADACGAVGCRETERLVEIVEDRTGRRRVLCPGHVRRWLE